jgi:regulator of protease activity HflC (stomatin/prohibitin superfamily)
MDAMMAMRRYGMFEPQPTGPSLRRGGRVTVKQWEQGLLFRHGRLDTVLDPGGHRRWASGYSLRAVDMRPWVILVPTQEVPTADGVTVKVTLAGQARVTDASTFVTAARDTEQVLYLALQVALREVAATTPIDDLLAGRGEMGSRLMAQVRGLEGLGVVVDQLEMKDIILPAELKKAQSETLIARAHSAAALERARGETAALRTLANAARMAAENPTLLQLRLLQQLDASTGHTVVIGASPFGPGIVPAPASPTDRA